MLSSWSSYFMDKVQTWRLSLGTNIVQGSSTAEANKDIENPVNSEKLAMWHKVNLERTGLESIHHCFWWSKHTGKILAIALYNAGYSSDLQYRDLKFFSQIVAPSLGTSLQIKTDGMPRWPSFMTDDGTPLELSWDWGTDGNSPKVRYSIEPVGLDAGTPLDPGNLKAGPAFQEQLTRFLPAMNLEWFNHFETFFNARNQNVDEFIKDKEDHNTSIFYAFDLSSSTITVKTYFFPKTRAKTYSISHLDTISQAIASAPYVTKDNLKAWSIFLDFCSEASDTDLEHEMLAIDHIEPLKSRLKIYFRCRETTLRSVINIMSLGGRITNPKLYEGLGNLARLWSALFEVDMAPNQPLGESGHRTAGILYNVEFRIGDLLPVAKVYLPVRHYSSSDEAVIKGLGEYFEYHSRAKYMPEYIDTMRTLLASPASLDNLGYSELKSIMDSRSIGPCSRVHTYIGCAIRPDGSLRVVSYFKPTISNSLSSPGEVK